MNYYDIPKVELHVHLDGSMKPETVASILNMDLDEVKKEMTVTEDCHDLNEYLTKFALPIKALNSRENLYRAARELALDLKLENVVYAEVRFAPMQHVSTSLSKEDIVESVLEGFKSVDGIIVNTILCMMRNASFETNLEVIDLASKYAKKGVVGIDLAGAEALYKTSSFKDLFDIANKNNLMITIHAGEADGVSSIESALNFNARRIGHGIRIVEDMTLLDRTINEHICFEVCPTSNVQTLAAPDIKNHPIDLLYKKGALVSINTDNRTVSNTSLEHEYEVLSKTFGYKVSDFIKMNEYAIESSFADEDTKNKVKKLIHNFELTIQNNKDE